MAGFAETPVRRFAETPVPFPCRARPSRFPRAMTFPLTSGTGQVQCPRWSPRADRGAAAAVKRGAEKKFQIRKFAEHVSVVGASPENK
jgi:hypothetical protein